jgi:ABC-type branched-subunit amino acid transport system ATPase component
LSLLTVQDLSIRFGGIVAVDDVSFAVEPGEVFTIVGPNGAGKSTIFNLISRFYEPSSGSLHFDGHNITRMKPEQIAQLGIARTFQNIELFEHSTVLQNLLVGRHSSRRTHFLQDIFFTPATRREEIKHREHVESVIDFFDLQPYRDNLIAGLPYGVRKVVEIARAMSSAPKIILLDEPASGLSVEETQDMAFWIEDMQKDMGLTVLMVEHDMGLVSKVSDRVLALADGRPLALGTAEEVQKNADVIEAYLGDADAAGNAAAEESTAAEVITGSAANANLTTAANSAGDTAADNVLELNNIETSYGPILALRGVSLSVQQGQIVTILGANGAGKTTLLKTVCGVMDPTKGQVLLNGAEIQGREPDHIVKAGVAHVPEGREVFPLLSVEENLMMGAYSRTERAGINQDMDMVMEYFPALSERRQQTAGTLSGGQQQMLAIGRGLMTRPSVLLLDEPSLGLSPLLVQEIFGIIQRLNSEQGVTMLLVEQNASVALKTAHYGYVLEIGRIVMAGEAQKLLDSQDIQEFYLGDTGDSQRDQKRWKRKKTWR